ncbi:uncharacterized protein LOC103517694 [Diaphorina citri]|uniref:Uncharacterized protein LOC103517694 n=1 Tax=Diaphorina citri TaxID=121845 RepID=A0A1S3DG65_DIACI|nr:uncharacterized protein LOC103517694 [Diaphorina citri]
MSCCTMNSENHPDTENRAFDMIHNSKSAKTKKMRSEPNMKNKFHLEASHHYSEHIHNLGSQMGDGPYTNVNKDIAIDKMKELWDNSEEINKIYDKLYEKDEEDFAVSLMKTISEETTSIKKSSELITNQNNDKTCHNVINSETIADRNLVGVRKEAESTRFTDSTDPVTELSLESGVLVGMQG